MGSIHRAPQCWALCSCCSAPWWPQLPDPSLLCSSGMLWGATHCSVLPGVRILNSFLQNQAPNPLSRSCSFVFPPHSTCTTIPPQQAFILKCRQIGFPSLVWQIGFLSLFCQLVPFRACTWWPSFCQTPEPGHRGGVTAIPSELCVLLGAAAQLFPGTAGVSCAHGVLISVWLPWPGGIPQGVDSVVPSRSRGTSRNSHGLFLSQCSF